MMHYMVLDASSTSVEHCSKMVKLSINVQDYYPFRHQTKNNFSNDHRLKGHKKSQDCYTA